MKNQLKIGSFLSYLQMGLGIVIGIVYTPFMIRLLGQSEYGLYNTASSTISMLSVLSLGFNSSYIRYYSRYKQKNDVEKIYKLNGLFLIIFLVIGFIALTCGLYLSNHLDIVFASGLTEKEYETARILMILLTINLAVSFPMSVFSNIISAHERFLYLRIVGMLKTVFGPLVTLPLLLMGYRSVAMVAVTVLIALISDILYFVYVIFVLKNKFIFHGFEKGIFKNLFVYTMFIAVNMVIDQINWNIGKILLGRFNGTTAVAVFSVGYSLSNYYMSFSTAISSVFTPRIHHIINSTKENILKQKEMLTDLFIKVGRIQFLILGLIASGLVFFGREFILVYWAGPGYEDAYYVALLLIFPLTIPLIQNLGIEIQRAENKHRFRSIVYAGMAIMNLILSWYLCQFYGAIGGAVGTALSYIVANGLIMNIYYHRECNINIILFWKNILQIFKGLIIPICLGIAINIFIDYSGFLKFVGVIVIYSATYFISMWLFSMNEFEKSLVKQSIRKVRKK